MVYRNIPKGYALAVPSIAGNLRTIRRAQDLTQDQLAEAAGLTQGSISAWEKGHKDPEVSSLMRLAKALGCTMNDLVRGVDAEYDATVDRVTAGAPPRQIVTYERGGPKTPGAHLLLKRFEQVGEKGREALLAMAKALPTVAAPAAERKAEAPGAQPATPTDSKHGAHGVPKQRGKK